MRLIIDILYYVSIFSFCGIVGYSLRMLLRRDIVKMKVIKDAMQIIGQIRHSANTDDMGSVFVTIHKFKYQHSGKGVDVYVNFHYESLCAMAHNRLKLINMERRLYQTQNPGNNY